MADTATPETAVDVVTDSPDRDVNYVSNFITNISHQFWNFGLTRDRLYIYIYIYIYIFFFFFIYLFIFFLLYMSIFIMNTSSAETEVSTWDNSYL